MNSVQSLMEKKAALEKEMAQTIKQAESERRKLEQQIEHERQAQVEAGMREIKKIMETHNLNHPDVVRRLHSENLRQKGQIKDEDTGLLAEMRRYYNSF